MDRLITEEQEKMYSKSIPAGFHPCMQTVVTIAKLLTLMAVEKFLEDPSNKELKDDDWICPLYERVFPELQIEFYEACKSECICRGFGGGAQVSDLMLIYCNVITYKLPELISKVAYAHKIGTLENL